MLISEITRLTGISGEQFDKWAKNDIVLYGRERPRGPRHFTDKDMVIARILVVLTDVYRDYVRNGTAKIVVHNLYENPHFLTQSDVLYISYDGHVSKSGHPHGGVAVDMNAAREEAQDFEREHRLWKRYTPVALRASDEPAPPRTVSSVKNASKGKRSKGAPKTKRGING